MDNTAYGCPDCQRRLDRQRAIDFSSLKLAKLWLWGLVWAVAAGGAGMLCVWTFSLWRFLSESGRTEIFSESCNDRTGCMYNHAGWGYGLTTAIFLLIAVTLVAVYRVLCEE